MSNGRMTLIKTNLLSRIALLGFCFFTGLLGASQTAFATDSTLTITLSESTVTADVAPTATPSGTFVQSSSMTVGVSTNHISGYTLSIKADDTTYPGRLKNGNYYLQSIANETTLNDFRSADLSNSNLATSLGLSDCTEITESSNCKGIWGYKPSKLNSATNTNFLPTPGTSGNIIDVTSEPNTTENEYTITLGAKVSPLATVGSYTNAFVFAVVGNNIPFTMEFSENTVENMPVNILDGSSNDATATIPSGTPTRDGYEFLGWCDQATTKSGDTDTCASGHQYQPSQSYTLDATATANNIKFYAMWKPVTYMQDLTSTTIASLLPSVGSTATVKDKRDQQDYTIAKLADNKYWMVENLNLAGGTALSADDTDVTSAYISSFSTSNNLTKTGDTIILPASSTSGFNTANYSYVYNSGNKTNCGASGQNTPCYSYYSWDAATLGSGRTIAKGNTDAPYSICPKGWKLPTSRTTSASNWQTAGDFYTLAHQYGLDSTTSTSESDNGFYTQAGPGTVPSFLLAGRYNSGSFINGGSYGYYWSSTSDSNTSYACYLYFNSSYVDLSDILNRSRGMSVRCLFSGQ